MLRKTVLLLVLPLAFVGCDLLDGGIDSIDQEQLEPLEGGINFSVREFHPGYQENVAPEIFLFAATEKIFPCFNYYLHSEIVTLGNTILVAIQGAKKPDICLTALGPARMQEPLELSPGVYHLVWKYRDATDVYQLEITDTSIVVSGDSGSFTRPEFHTFWRYPPNSFALVCGTTPEFPTIRDEFVDTLLSVVSLREFQFPRGGVIPYPTRSSGHYIDLPARYFYYDTEADYDRAGEVLRDFSRRRIRPGSGVSIYLVNWKNRWFRSWHPGG
ncbi:MAG: hypothetical protein D6681_13635 [Calditrichaeota bacterium]|nr:MAG: hypothetical protein D6681_13635 [Calditrichota bacterium]